MTAGRAFTSIWSDPRDGDDVRRVVLCPACASAMAPVLLNDIGFGVLAGACAECQGVFCACRGEGGCRECPLPGAKLTVPKLRIYLQAGQVRGRR